SLDLDRGLFHCFACSAQGTARRFAELVGEAPPPRSRAAQTATPPTTQASLRDFMRAAALTQKWAQPGVLELYELADHLRHWRRFIARARRQATDTPASWDLLELAAYAELRILMVEFQLDEDGACA